MPMKQLHDMAFGLVRGWAFSVLYAAAHLELMVLIPFPPRFQKTFDGTRHGVIGVLNPRKQIKAFFL